MSLNPFTLVEMNGMSIVTATWFMFMVAIGTGVVYFTLREFNMIGARIDKHCEEIVEIRDDMSTMRENVAVTRNVVERIERMVDAPK